METNRALLTARYGFDLDGFQRDALNEWDAGRSVLVAAPTGSGKTVVAEYAIADAVQRGQRAFYTAPIKALSNQKYSDLVRIHGLANVGLLTGDNVINGDAPIVVMTTEVLRNMIYARSAGLARLGVVVLDEVHYLQDTYRGPVWEEIIIHLRVDVRLVCLSATVSNAAELAEWITTVRGPTSAIIEHERPVTLHHLYFMGDRTSDRTHLLPTLVDGRANSEAARIDGEAARGARAGNRQRARRKLYTPSRIDVVERLDDERMLPAVYFIFSRNACDDAAKTLVDARVRLTTGPDRDRIREIARNRLDGLDERDLAVLGYGRFIAALENGVATHHAGMVPPFKEVVESCFVEGLVKVVFATETLAVGINMPARTVVIEKLTKFTGEHHAPLTPGEYTQLTGRAGRRGIDDVGFSVVLWSPFIPFEQVAALASSRSYNLVSAFRPTYNMAANLVRTYRREEAEGLLARSFAQYQADGEIVRLASRMERRRQALAEARADSVSRYGDIDEYRALLNRTETRKQAFGWNATAIAKALIDLRPGDVVLIEKGRYVGRAAVLSTAARKGHGVKVRAITPNRVQLILTEEDFEQPPRPQARIDLPTPYAPNRQTYQREVARALERVRLAAVSQPVAEAGDARAGDHPVRDDPDLGARLKAAAAADRIQRELDDLTRRVDSRNGSLAATFAKVLDLLTRWGHLDGWALTNSGARLARMFHECELLVVETMERGLFDGLDAASLASLVSVFTYEHRSPDPPPAPWFPSNEVRGRWRAIESLARELRIDEERIGLARTRMPDPTFSAVAYAWAAGETFAEVVEAEELSGGDFVRNIRQLGDLLRQIAELASVAATRRAAAQAVELLVRGVVAASTAVEIDAPSVP